MESDILRVFHGGPYKKDGQEVYILTVKLKGDPEPIRSTYRTPLDMSRDLTAVLNAWEAWAEGKRQNQAKDEFAKMQERLDETERRIAEWQEKSRRAGTEQKKRQKKKRQEPDFTPPTDEEIRAYITEKGFDKKLGLPADVIAESFRSIYEKEPEKDGRSKWQKANGEPVRDWKGCMRTYISREKVFEARSGAKPQADAKAKAKNQFNNFEQNEYDFGELEKDLLASGE